MLDSYPGFIAVLLYGLVEFAVHRSRVSLIDLQFTHHRSHWHRDGRPQGSGLTRGEVTFFGSYLARLIVGWKWLASTPGWLASTPGGTTLLRRYRTLWWFSVFAIVLLVIFVVGAQAAA